MSQVSGAASTPASENPQRDPGAAFAIALGSISFIGPLAVHVFLPVIPAVREAFAISNAKVQLTFSIALFTMAFSTLVYGSLSDRLGRRPVLLSGLAFFVAGSLLCLMATTIETLVFGRFVQAIGAGCGITLVRTIARDAYGPERLVKAIAYLTMFYTIGPLIAPLVGGFTADIFGWRSIFVLALVAGVAILAGAWLLVPETKPQGTGPKQPAGSMLRAYGELFSHWRFASFVFQTGMSTATFFTMAAACSSLMKDVLDRPASDYGMWFAVFPIGYFTGNWISARIGSRAKNENMVMIGSVVGLSASIVQCAFLLAGVVNPLVLFLPGLFSTMAQGIALPYAQSGAMATIPRLVGTASGIGVFLQSFLGGLFAQIFGLLADGTVMPMVIVTMICATGMFVAGALPWMFQRR